MLSFFFFHLPQALIVSYFLVRIRIDVKYTSIVAVDHILISKYYLREFQFTSNFFLRENPVQIFLHNFSHFDPVFFNYALILKRAAAILKIPPSFSMSSTDRDSNKKLYTTSSY